MNEIIIATNNNSKLKEFNEILSVYNIKCLSLQDINFTNDIIEDGNTFQENAFIKAKTIFDVTKKPVLADDSGLCVVALNNAPGIYSARYMNLNTFDEKMDYIINQLKDKNKEAFFNCTLCLYTKNDIHYFEGILKGNISLKKTGVNGFGYDPIFIPNNFDKTLAQLNSNIKNEISHRSQAVKKLVDFLNENNIF